MKYFKVLYILRDTTLNLYFIIIGSFLCITAVSCKKYIEVDPPIDRVSEASVYETDATASAVLTGLYTNLSSSSDAFMEISLSSGLLADEYTLYDGNTNTIYLEHYSNSLDVINGGSHMWSKAYAYIFSCNSAIEGLTISSSLTPAVKQQLVGESKFLRAFFYFYLVNLYGNVPLALTTAWQVNSALPRSPKVKVYEQIISDLKDAQRLLSSNYLKADAYSSYLIGTEERVRPTKWAATALLARTYLYAGNYADAEVQASLLIDNTSLFGLTDLNNTFLKNSKEAIWQLQPVNTGWNTEAAKQLIIPDSGPSVLNPVYLSDKLMNSFDTNDLRKSKGNWVNNVTVSGIDYYFPYKYKSATLDDFVTEYLMVFRLGEQYLIRAEARAHQNNIDGAKADLNAIRNRAFSTPHPTSANDKASLLSEIFHERQVELFSEWGHRWLDIKRTNSVDSVMNIITPLKTNGAQWKSYQQLYPIPSGDIKLDPQLDQNPGY